MSPDRVPKQASLADCRLPGKVSWHAKLLTQLEQFLVRITLEEDPQHQTFSLQAAYTAQVQDPDAPSKIRLLWDQGRIPMRALHSTVQQQASEAYRGTVPNMVTLPSHRDNSNTDRSDRTCPMCEHKVTNPGLPAAQF